MASGALTLGIIFVTQIIVGILGNLSLFCHYINSYFTGCRLRTTDLILKHMIVGNSFSLLCKGVPEAMAAFGWEHFLSDLGCKLLSFLHRVGRGVSIGSICLLSILQATTISPWTSRWAQLKVKAPKYITPSLVLCWILQMLVNVIFPICITRKLSDKNVTDYKDFGYCSSIRHNKATDSVFAALLSFPDVVCLGLMLGASSCMVLILHRHKQRVRHIRTANVALRSSPESRATKSILLLVSTFVYFYTLSSIFQAVLALSNNPGTFLVNITGIMAMLFPAISPFLLMSHDSSISSLCFAWIRNVKSPHLWRNM
ncbi:vomeronasal type-1 receptor 4-like [Manis javanica]|uniref:vomeronasal type-1 receptor 4-like n=1 Tax=Manis javanica TaxID=9974 RepID=UPI003C6D4E79